MLDTGDVIDPVIGNRAFKTKSSEELAGLTVLVEWAKAARLLRVAGGRLLPVMKNAKLLERPLQLWSGFFEAIPRIGVALLPPGWAESFLSHEYGVGVEALLARLYAAEAAVPVDELCEVVWTRVTAPYLLDDPKISRGTRQAPDRRRNSRSSVVCEFWQYRPRRVYPHRHGQLTHISLHQTGGGS